MKTKYYVYALFIAVFCLAACNGDAPDTEVVEINETTLKGTWEGSVEHDMAQGYTQKYRIAFDGNTYTVWHMYQEIVRVSGEYKLENVGNKESGTWEYADGVLTMTPKKQFASHFISSMSPLEYTIYVYDVDTMESNPWYETPEYFVETAEKTTWTVVLRGDTLEAKINMDTFQLKKK